MKYFVFFISMIFCAGLLAAQPALVKASANKDTILLGEPFWLTLEIRAPGGSRIEPFKVDTIPHFEFLKKDSTTKTREGGATLIRQYFQLTSFDSGQWVIPPFELRPFVKTNSLLVNVVFTRPFDPKQPYHDVQDVRTVPIRFAQWLGWLALALAIILLLVVVVYFLRNKKLGILPQWPRLSPYEMAVKSLKTLKEQQPEENIFYERLVNIFRNYVLNRTGIESLQQTAADLAEKLKRLYDKEGDTVSYNALAQVLQLSDLVKFAKYNPEDSEALSAYEVIEQSIELIEQKVNTSTQEKNASAGTFKHFRHGSREEHL